MLTIEERKKRASEATKKWQRENPERVKSYRNIYCQSEGYKARAAQYARQWRKKYPEKTRECNRKYFQTHKLQRREYHRRIKHKVRMWNITSKHGLSSEQYHALMNRQNSMCAICGEQLYLDSRTHVDHDHSTGDIRGILCHYCNTGIGLFKDKPEVLEKAIKYLARRIR